jgi:hypothetical protein
MIRPQTPYEAKVFRLGASPERQLPVGADRARILIRGTITDNATTAADLLSTMFDRAILDVAGLSTATSNPKVVIRFERLGFALDAPAETPALTADLIQNIELIHTPAGGNTRTRRLQLHRFIASNYASSSIAAGPLYGNVIQRGTTYRVPFSPLVVNAEVDSLTIAPRVAVNTAANVPFSLFADVFIHSNAGWVRQDPQCSTADEDSGFVIENAESLKSDALFSESGAGAQSRLRLQQAIVRPMGGAAQRVSYPK